MIPVVAGILLDDQRVLLSERIGDSPFAGLWEFPGGKIETGETVEDALVRELDEELGIEAQAWRAFLSLDHRYADRHVQLQFFLVTSWSGVPRGLDGQKLRWADIDALDDKTLLPADAPVVEALQAMIS